MYGSQDTQAAPNYTYAQYISANNPRSSQQRPKSAPADHPSAARPPQTFGPPHTRGPADLLPRASSGECAPQTTRARVLAGAAAIPALRYTAPLQRWTLDCVQDAAEHLLLHLHLCPQLCDLPPLV